MAFLPKEANRTSFCSRGCAFAAKKDRAARERPERDALLVARAADVVARRKVGSLRTCDECGRVYLGRQARAHLCSNQCRVESGRKAAFARYADRAKAIPAEHLTCEQCSAPFVRAYPERYRDRYCSTSCGDKQARGVAKQRRRARMRGVQNVAIRARDIYQRDQWVCGLCYGPIDRQAKAPHPQSASLDHIIPLSLGGPHLPDNVQCAHFGCNTKKGNRMPVASPAQSRQVA